MYERIVRELAPALTEAEARGVVGSMRLQYATLDHLPRSTFAREIRTALACESAEPGYLAACAEGVQMPYIKVDVNDGAGERLEALAKLTRRSVPEVIDTLSHADMRIMLECEAARAVAAQPKGKASA